MKIINSPQIVNTRVKLLGLFPNKFNSWYENQTTTDLRLHAIPQATPNLCIFNSPISIFRICRYRGVINHIIKLLSTKKKHLNCLGLLSIITSIKTNGSNWWHIRRWEIISGLNTTFGFHSSHLINKLTINKKLADPKTSNYN